MSPTMFNVRLSLRRHLLDAYVPMLEAKLALDAWCSEYMGLKIIYRMSLEWAVG
jgi:hypothetical protein